MSKYRKFKGDIKEINKQLKSMPFQLFQERGGVSGRYLRDKTLLNIERQVRNLNKLSYRERQQLLNKSNKLLKQIEIRKHKAFQKELFQPEKKPASDYVPLYKPLPESLRQSGPNRQAIKDAIKNKQDSVTIKNPDGSFTEIPLVSSREKFVAQQLAEGKTPQEITDIENLELDSIDAARLGLPDKESLEDLYSSGTVQDEKQLYKIKELISRGDYEEARRRIDRKIKSVGLFGVSDPNAIKENYLRSQTKAALRGEAPDPKFVEIHPREFMEIAGLYKNRPEDLIKRAQHLMLTEKARRKKG